MSQSPICRLLAAAAVVVVGVVSMEASAVGGTPSVRLTGESLPGAVRGFDATAAGVAVPELGVIDLRPERVPISRDGQPHVLLFLSRRGSACRRQTAALRDWFDQDFVLPRGLAYSAIWEPGTTARHRGMPRWLKTWPIPVLRDSPRGAAATAFGAGRLPMWVFVDRSGALVGRYSGYLGIENLAELLYRLGMLPRPGSATP